MNRELELSVLPPGRGEELEIESWHSQWFNQSCLCNEASMKTKKDGLWRASRLVNRWKFGESGTFKDSMEAPRPFLRVLLYASFPSRCSSVFFIISFYSKLVFQ